jgi:membrane protease YdiL (CAAX protease family)
MSEAPGARPPASDTIPIDYWLPMVLFGALTLAESYLDPAWFPIAYIVKAVLVTAALVRLRRPYADLKYDRRVILPSVAIGLLVFALWIWIDKVVPYPHFGSRSAFDPTPLQGSAWWPAFLAVRLYGLALMVPVMEEIFWRSFLLRYLTRTDFESLPVGTFSAFALHIRNGWWLSSPAWRMPSGCGAAAACSARSWRIRQRMRRWAPTCYAPESGSTGNGVRHGKRKTNESPAVPGLQRYADPL